MKPSEQTVQIFMQDRFATENGAVIDEVDDHYAKCSLKIEDRHRNAMGAVMGASILRWRILPLPWQVTGRRWEVFLLIRRSHILPLQKAKN